jgi:hypothetical protein
MVGTWVIFSILRYQKFGKNFQNIIKIQKIQNFPNLFVEEKEKIVRKATLVVIYFS